MILNVSRIDTWEAMIDDRPGALAAKLEGLAAAGADLEYVIARRSSTQPDMGVVLVTPLTSQSQIDAAARVGFRRSQSLHTVRVEGPDQPGVGFLIARAIAADGINLRGFSACRIGNRFTAYLAFDCAEDADRALARLNRPI